MGKCYLALVGFFCVCLVFFLLVIADFPKFGLIFFFFSIKPQIMEQEDISEAHPVSPTTFRKRVLFSLLIAWVTVGKSHF